MRLLTLFFFLFAAATNYAQVTLSGNVSSKQGNPLPGVNVYLKGTYDGGTTGANGLFSFKSAQTDSLIVVATCIGFEPKEQFVTDPSQKIVFRLTEKVNELSAVSITAGTIDVSDKASSMVMKPLDVVTTAGALADITGALNTLPGTATVANDGRLFVRGGDASETAIFFDGLRVGNAYGSTTSGLPTRNRFNAALFKGTFFSTGGYSAEYGGALSSVLALETIDEPVRNQTDLSFMSVGLSAASTLVGEKQSISAELAYTDLNPYQELIRQNFDFELAPRTLQGQALYRHKLGNEGMVKGFLQMSGSQLIIWQPQPGEEGRGQRIAINNTFGFGNASYKKIIAEKWISEGGMSLSLNTDNLEIDSNKYQTDNRLFHVKQKLTHYFTDALKLKSGAEVMVRDYKSADKVLDLSNDFEDIRSALFAEVEWFASTSLSIRGGLRGNYGSLNNEFKLEPRVAAAFRPYKQGIISVAAGIFSQNQNENIQLLSGNIADQEAGHLQLSFQHGSDDRIFRIEGYLKSYSQLAVKTENGYRAQGQGYANGFDLFYRDRTTFKNTDFWVTYSFVDSRRQYEGFQTEVQPSFAPKHNLSVVGKYWIADWKSLPGATFSWNSGYTYDDQNLIGEMESVSPCYASLSVNWSYLWKQNLIVHVACNNVLGRENIFGYTYANQPDENGKFQSMAQGQPAARFLFVGVFWTISKHKEANQLNNL
ncbi:TonB-dependent receptor [Cryomorpha ignava]|uniref:TonB-dependent receptor n=1 Tax=Cryomorpha ignava TaxID=101383 RepID=A0A7K3WMD6_9FLAO|nr:TonB-dependent receptor [Cryomorpha ignava]NEN22688.1 TonB-dependent receptor [Cryomorpha ignava]